MDVSQKCDSSVPGEEENEGTDKNLILIQPKVGKISLVPHQPVNIKQMIGMSRGIMPILRRGIMTTWGGIMAIWRGIMSI